MDAGRGIYLGGKDSRDSSTDEESPSVGLQEKSSEIIPFEGFVGKEMGAQPPLTIESFLGSLKNLVVFPQISRTLAVDK